MSAISENESVVYEKADGTRLIAGRIPGVPVMGLRVDDPGEERGGELVIAVDDLEDVTRRLYEAAGRTLPVMLGRPEIDIAQTTTVGQFQVWKEPSGHVGFMPANADAAAVTGALRLAPHAVRQLAAVAVAYADAEVPDDDDGEFELASILARHPHATFPEMARAVLADGRFGRLEVPRA